MVSYCRGFLASQVKASVHCQQQLNRRLCSRKQRREVEQYLERQASDQYSRRAKEHSYRARSAFKLQQINEKMHFIRPGLVAIDAGAAPGSWCQVLSELIFPADEALGKIEDGRTRRRPAGYILGVDLQSISPVVNVDLLCKADFTRPATQAEIRRRLGDRRVDLLLSDMSPNPTGDSYTDHLRIMELCRALLHFGTAPDEPGPILAHNAVFLCKIFDGPSRKEFTAELKAHFRRVNIVKPDASRESSFETYVFASGYMPNGKKTSCQ